MRTWKVSSVTLSVLSVLLGIVVFVYPGATLRIVAQMLGIGILALGLSTMIPQLLDKENTKMPMVSAGVLATIAGIFIIAKPGFIVSIIPFIVGVVILVNGIINLRTALVYKDSLSDKTSYSMILAILTVIGGIAIIFNAFLAASFILQIIGAVLVYNGVSNLIVMFWQKA
ncbi:Uncharacterized membrane protein HdeD, DUF308 family [Acetitomaculum ruminis DSM 5522]|uniref:Uncharacterized membrane protein HdeD, DUF308 family n=1 Tax=Acetitomaculum ruminis DSM 5522 TaxID=1120918 RepID=A0A1I0WJH9_9FIRM|nr:DUF308 domain-containing protein [Acetitomaculum ruminis]SFA88925.1 Uncharacterized membrane protein HdeD, DUF308 family [Acetitomaculum ruminis DSM 5522]